MATILTKRSNTASSVPVAGDLTNSTGGAELAVNTADKRLFTKDSGGTVVELGTNPSSLTLTGGTANGVPYLNASKVLTTGSALQFDGSNLGLGVTPSAWSAYKAVQVGAQAALAYNSNVTVLATNWYEDAVGNKYIGTGFATQYYQLNGAHVWRTAPSGTAGNAISFTQAMTLDASGNFAVGTTNSAPANGFGMVVGSSGNAITRIDLRNSTTGVAQGDGTSLYLNGNDFTIENRENGFTSFYNNGSERARIDSSGSLLVGTTSVVTTGVQGVSIAAGSGGVRVGNSGSGGFVHFYCYNSNGIVGSITSSGSTTSYNTSSDYRLKNTIAPMTGALAKVALLKPCTYKWNADGSDGEGFIAHELAEVCPQAVTGEKDAVDADGNPVYQGIDTSFLAGLYAAALQELNAKVEALTAELNTLKGN